MSTPQTLSTPFPHLWKDEDVMTIETASRLRVLILILCLRVGSAGAGGGLRVGSAGAGGGLRVGSGGAGGGLWVGSGGAGGGLWGSRRRFGVDDNRGAIPGGRCAIGTLIYLFGSLRGGFCPTCRYQQNKKAEPESSHIFHGNHMPGVAQAAITAMSIPEKWCVCDRLLCHPVTAPPLALFVAWWQALPAPAWVQRAAAH